jgi:flagellar biosynthetic protein FlhB
MESSSQDRNLPASEQKLRKARKDGQVARSKDMSHLAVLGVGGLALLAIMPVLSERLKLAMGQQLSFSATTLTQPEMLVNRLMDMTLVGLVASAAFAAMVIAASVATTLAISGWVFSSKPVMPEWSPWCKPR